MALVADEGKESLTKIVAAYGPSHATQLANFQVLAHFRKS